MRANEGAPRPDAETRTGIARIWEVMQQCVRNGCAHDGVLPGPMRVKRRAPELRRQLSGSPQAGLTDPLVLLDWVSLYALAVNEENASGGRVVTAPTNGAAGIIPAVLHYYTHFVHGANVDGVECFLLTAAAIAPSSTRRTPRCQVPRSAVSARSVWPTQWPLARWLKCSAERQRS